MLSPARVLGMCLGWVTLEAPRQLSWSRCMCRSVTDEFIRAWWGRQVCVPAAISVQGVPALDLGLSTLFLGS